MQTSTRGLKPRPVERTVCSGTSKSEYGKVNVLKCSYLKTGDGFMKFIQMHRILDFKVLYLTLIFCPIFILSMFLISLFSSFNLSIVVLYFSVISEKVSPDFTV